MDYKDLNLKKFYDSDKDNLLQSFFIPTLSLTKKYRRLAGFFSSGILSAAARGIVGLIENGGNMQLMIGANLHYEDLAIAEDAQKNPGKYLEKVMIEELDKISDMFVRDHVEALGWMLANNLLEIRIGIVKDGGLFHLKVGVMEDFMGNKLSFSGSDNETPSGWRHNIEEFKVFRNWIPEETGYFVADEEKFDRFWSGTASKVNTMPLPEAVKKRLIITAPKKKENLKIWKKKHDADNHVPTYQNPAPRSVDLRPHQKNAIDLLNSHDGRGILSMATGSGKTITALAYAKNASTTNPLCTVIAVPYIHLAAQWIEKDIRPMFPGVPIIEVHGQAKDWRLQLPLFLSGFRSGAFKQIFIVGLYGSLADQDFVKILTRSKIDPSNLLFIADEVHNAGATEARNSLLDNYGKRLGLSATPERYFDEEGTDVVKNYFGGVIYEYSLSQAIRDGFLTPYSYFPIFVRLNDEEYSKYEEISSKISRLIASNRNSDTEIFDNIDVKRLLLQRSKLIKNANNKIVEISSLLSNLNKNGIANTLIYCDGMEQLDKVQSILNDLSVINHKFTQNETVRVREEILKNFAEGIYKALVAVKCLDEGVDVPATQMAIIMASTTNPREFIQRRGRVLRKDPMKSKATVYDFIVLPPSRGQKFISQLEQTIIKKEFERVRDFIETASNKAEIYSNFLAIMQEFGVYL